MNNKRFSSQKLVYLIFAVLLMSMTLSCSMLNFSDTGKILSVGNHQAAEPGTSLTSPSKQLSAVPEGYRAVCSDGDTYIAVGSDGRIDRIRPDKTVTRIPAAAACLNDVISINGTAVAAGDDGVILCAKDGGDFKEVNSGTTESLYSLALFHEIFLAAGADGTLLCSPDGEHWTSMKSGTENNILSIAANEQMCMAVTRESEILISTDGETWNIMDYNTFYKGCSEPCLFRSVRACSDAFFIAGEYLNFPGTPAILSTDTGEIWSEHVLNEINDKPAEEFYPLIINAVALDWDQLVAICNDGMLLTVTECIVCNKLDVLCDKNINDLASGNGFLILVGDDFWFDICKSDAFRQFHIAAAQALKDYNNGAYIVDVRTDNEYAQQHIKGCVHIPLDELEAKLEQEIPDKTREIIFYCQKGVRAQQALEKALLMGYEKVYNLGGIGDWPFETETGSVSGGE